MTIFSGFFRWLYHYRQRRAAKRRLSGKTRPAQRWSTFSYSPFRRATFGKYDLPEIRLRTIFRLLLIPAIALLLWFLWISYHSWGIFQP